MEALQLIDDLIYGILYVFGEITVFFPALRCFQLSGQRHHQSFYFRMITESLPHLLNQRFHFCSGLPNQLISGGRFLLAGVEQLMLKNIVGELRFDLADTTLREIGFIDYIFADGKKDAAYMREQVNSIRFVQERYAWFLEGAFGRTFEKKKGQRKKPLAQQIYESCLDAFVSGVSLGKSSEVDAPSVSIQYAVLELDETHHELVEKLYFDPLTDFVYVELMRGLQRGYVPKRCANCGRWFLQTPGHSYNYCGEPAPNSEEGKTCREVGSTKSFRAKVLNNEVWAVHQRAYKKYFARTRKGTMSRAEFEVWERESERLREEALVRYERAVSPGERQEMVDKLAEELNRV